MSLTIEEVSRMATEILNEYTSAQKSIDIELTEMFAPMRGAFSRQENRKRYVSGKTILNSHPLKAVDKCASGFSSYLSDQTKTWFVAKLLNGESKSEETNEWLANLSRDMRLILSQSNIYSELNNMYKEFNIYGRGCFMLARDFNDVIRGYGFTAGSYGLGRDNTGRINSFVSMQKKRCNQIVMEFGLNNCPETIRNAYNNKNFSQYFEYTWIIYDQKEFGSSGIGKDKRWRSVKYLTSGTNQILEDNGFDYWPVVCAIGNAVDSTQIYPAEYPGVYALPDAKELQALQKDLNKINAYNANPPMVSYGMTDYSQMIPGGIMKFDIGMAQAGNGKVGMEPAYPYRDPTVLREEIALRKQEIDSAFYVDLFQLLKTLGPNRMTAYEVNRRYSEMIEAVGPVVLSLQVALQHLLDTVLFILFNTKVNMNGEMISLIESRIGRMPEELQGNEINFKFVGILAMLQRATEMLPIEQLVQFLTYLRSSVQGAGEDPMDWLDTDDVVTKYAENLGAVEHLKSEKEVLGIRKLRQEAMAQEQQKQDAMASIQAAGVLSQTPMGQGTAMGAVQGQL
jgi:hypothetical protein